MMNILFSFCCLDGFKSILECFSNVVPVKFLFLALTFRWCQGGILIFFHSGLTINTEKILLVAFYFLAVVGIQFLKCIFWSHFCFPCTIVSGPSETWLVFGWNTNWESGRHHFSVLVKFDKLFPSFLDSVHNA